jgi:hypothetical protein
MRHGNHDIVSIIDEDTKKQLGIGLHCVSRKEDYNDRIGVNIQGFREAIKLGILGVIFEICTPTVKWIMFKPIDEAEKLIAEAHQPNGHDFKSVLRSDIEGKPQSEFRF